MTVNASLPLDGMPRVPDTLAAGSSQPGAAALAPLSPREQALMRLGTTRATLRAELVRPRRRLDLSSRLRAARGVRGDKPGLAANVSDWLRLLWEQIRSGVQSQPLGMVATTLAQDWWERQPLREHGEVLADELRHRVVPWVRRHPMAAALAAATVGGAVATIRPWRWIAAAHLPRRAVRWASRYVTSQQLQALAAAAIMGVFAEKFGNRAESASAPAGATGAVPSPVATEGSAGLRR